ncbi:hypothetical protein CAEBREN_28452 [Caenorhabditis brenneri]|uniref:Uncharacterized protein n=1 Tax=Caenorhabditis brenneri TaxID=135651 RepID=G0N4B8_CAEBE|nr:hypothetical protein CAEBREN_28452 [Caenorhabditis brenneri]
MPLTGSLCQVCRERDATGYSYGAFCCSACKMFFRRSCFVQNVVECPKGGNCTLKCRNCRFQRCIQAGMGYIPTENLHDMKHREHLSALVFNLDCQDKHRDKQLLTCHYEGNPTVADLALIDGPIPLTERPPDFQMNLPQWVFITGMTSLNHIKRFHHFLILNDSDRTSMLKYSFFDFSLLADAMRAREREQDFLCFPDGTDIILQEVIGVCDKRINEVRCRLAARVNELKMTREEYLLLSLLMTSMSGHPNISESGRGIVNSYQNMYKSGLIQHCMLADARNGAARCQDLMGLIYLVQQTRLGIGEIFMLTAIQKPYLRMPNIFKFP